MKWPFSKKTPAPEPVEPVEEKTVEKKGILGTSQSLGSFLAFGNNNAETPSSALQLYNDSTAVSIPINKIEASFSSIKPVLEIEEGVFITDHPLLELLQQPSEFFDGPLFMQTLAKDYLVTNETEIIALGNINRPPMELQPISPKNVSVSEGQGGTTGSFIVSGNTLAGQYNQTRRGRSVRYLDGNLRELKQIRGYSTRNNSLLRGQSPLVSAAAEARQHILGNTHNLSLLKNGGRPSLAIHYEEDVEPDDFEEVKEKVRAQYGGADNAGKIIVSTGGKMSVEELGVNNKDMDFATLQRMAMDSVALQYNVPLPLVSNTASTFNNYREGKLALYDDATLPLADRLYAGLSQFLLPRYGLDPKKSRITYDILSIPALRARVLEELKTRKDINIESDNELRSTIAREPYQGGNVILKPANLIPAGTDLVTDEPVVVRDQPDDEA